MEPCTVPVDKGRNNEKNILKKKAAHSDGQERNRFPNKKMIELAKQSAAK